MGRTLLVAATVRVGMTLYMHIAAWCMALYACCVQTLSEAKPPGAESPGSSIGWTLCNGPDAAPLEEAE